MGKEWPLLLRYLREDHGYRVHQVDSILGYELYEVDLSSWKLNLSDQTTVIWVKSADLRDKSPLHVQESLQDVVTIGKLRRKVVIVLLDSDGAKLRQQIANSSQRLVIVDSSAQESIRRSRRPIGELLDLVSEQVSLATLAPYETRSPVSGSRFFGRDYEISRILSKPDTNFAILGIRRIGKTSMLHQIQHELEKERQVRSSESEEKEGRPIIYLDCSDLGSIDTFVRETVRQLNPRELSRLDMKDPLFFFPNFLERMRRKYEARIVFLLDEIDNLLQAQRWSWDLLRMMRASANKRACQYVMAGFREALREQHNLDSPFFNFAEEIRLNEFTRRQAHDLIVTPMENLRIRFRNREEVVARIYEETAGHPNLIQYYCTILLRRLDETGEREIGLDNLIGVYTDEGFRSHLVDVFLSNTQNREKALVYAVLGEAGDKRRNAFPQEYMDETLRKRGLMLSHGQLNEACNVLVLAGVLHQKGRDYSFTSPVFAKVLEQTHDMNYLFRKLKEEGI